MPPKRNAVISSDDRCQVEAQPAMASDDVVRSQKRTRGWTHPGTVFGGEEELYMDRERREMPSKGLPSLASLLNSTGPVTGLGEEIPQSPDSGHALSEASTTHGGTSMIAPFGARIFTASMQL